MRFILFLACFSLVSFQLNANGGSSPDCDSQCQGKKISQLINSAIPPASCPEGSPLGKDPCTCGTAVEGASCQFGTLQNGTCQTQTNGSLACAVAPASSSSGCNSFGHSLSNWAILASILLGLFGLSKMLERIE